ncbi:MAG: TadE/TadG family type IV pilus assembly protein [Pseudomonadota bacterium]
MKRTIEIPSDKRASVAGFATTFARRIWAWVSAEVLRSAACRSGLAATEFALTLPIMLLMFFGLVEGGDALNASRRATVAANSLADLAAQSEELDETDVQNLFTGVETMLAPADNAGVEFRLMSVVLDPDISAPVIDWSVDNAGAEPYAREAPYNGLDDASILEEGASLIVVELVYEHKASLARRVFDDVIVFKRTSSRWPRLATTTVRFCANKPCL